MGFGRRPIQADPRELASYVLYQLGALAGITAAAGHRMTHMSFHGALGNMAAADEFYGADYILHDPNAGPTVPIGSASVRQYLAPIMAGFPDSKVTVDDVLAEEDKIAVRFTARGTHTGDFMGIPPSGRLIAAQGISIIRIANANMERAVRVSSAEKGYDPRDLMLVAFGGAGPMHAAALAKSAGIPTVLVPEQPGVLSAVGLVMADIRHDFVQTKVARGAALGGAHLEPLYAGLRRLGDEALAKDGIAAEHRVFRRSADLRYAGQAYEVNVEVPDGALDDAAVEAMRRRFHAMHKQLFAHNHPDKVVEFVSGRLTAIGLTSAPSILPRALTGGDVRPVERHRVYYEETGAYVDTPVYERATLVPGCRIDGPAIVEQSDTTTIIHPGQRADVDPYGNLLVHTGGAADAR